MVANGGFGCSRVSRFYRVNDGPVFRQCSIAAFTPSTTRWLKQKHSSLDVLKHLDNVPIVRAMVDGLVEPAIVIRQLSGIVQHLLFQVEHVAEGDNLHVGRVTCR